MTDAVIRTVEAAQDQEAEMKEIAMDVTKIVVVAIGTAEDATTGRVLAMSNIFSFNFVAL